LNFFVKYLESIQVIQLLLQKFSKLKKSAKGTSVANLFKQALCFFFDGTSRHLVHFDHVAQDEGYAAVIENDPEQMASSHTMKRWFKAFGVFHNKTYQWVLRRLFLWRLKLKQPDLIILTIDTMVMNNDEAEKREGCDPTYKKVKGFQPLQVIWEGKIVDALFRRGKKHSNFGKEPARLLEELVEFIRENYRRTVPIIVRLDGGFFDEHLFSVLDEMSVGFVATGKMLETIRKKVSRIRKKDWKTYDNGRQEWSYAGFRYKCDKWEKDYRALYTRPVYEGKQELLEFARPDNIILTNLEEGTDVWNVLSQAERRHWSQDTVIIESHHQRGADELPHRGLKEFGSEQLPFKNFAANRAYYYLMVISFFLFETFKEDGLKELLPVGTYATKVRRTIVDIAAKVVRGGRERILKVTESVMKRLRLDRILELISESPPIPVT